MTQVTTYPGADLKIQVPRRKRAFVGCWQPEFLESPSSDPNQKGSMTRPIILGNDQPFLKGQKETPGLIFHFSVLRFPWIRFGSNPTADACPGPGSNPSVRFWFRTTNRGARGGGGRDDLAAPQRVLLKHGLVACSKIILFCLLGMFFVASKRGIVFGWLVVSYFVFCPILRSHQTWSSLKKPCVFLRDDQLTNRQ